ncbi:hypothetical protein CYMTET_45312 [Cymbomonas tetramitiformis]|uniref:EF-hand domain-containing protein n=1 Tax=Cymbomonas tetramitiformis TaxID=36881 RepID=A0AAE0BZK6_9CHLO|nr:hypothetical protein CYMTET_45312 [Cymbomonas tetramitiformis]
MPQDTSVSRVYTEGLLREVFQVVDEDRDGFATKGELLQAFKLLGLEIEHRTETKYTEILRGLGDARFYRCSDFFKAVHRATIQQTNADSSAFTLSPRGAAQEIKLRLSEYRRSRLQAVLMQLGPDAMIAHPFFREVKTDVARAEVESKLKVQPISRRTGVVSHQDGTTCPSPKGSFRQEDSSNMSSHPPQRCVSSQARRKEALRERVQALGLPILEMTNSADSGKRDLFWRPWERPVTFKTNDPDGASEHTRQGTSKNNADLGPVGEASGSPASIPSAEIVNAHPQWGSSEAGANAGDLRTNGNFSGHSNGYSRKVRDAEQRRYYLQSGDFALAPVPAPSSSYCKAVHTRGSANMRKKRASDTALVSNYLRGHPPHVEAPVRLPAHSKAAVRLPTHNASFLFPSSKSRTQNISTMRSWRGTASEDIATKLASITMINSWSAT